MAHWRSVFVLIFILTSSFGAQGSKYTDENRPYEFGFSIDGEQHRHEKKDENGIIMGEFGFITADGVYHVTVYATDENGNFKIISMKNIRVKPYPSAVNAKDTRTGHALSLPPQSSAVKTSVAPSYSQTTPPPQQTKKPINPLLEPVRACSHCSLPTTTTAKPIYSEVNAGAIPPNNENGLGSPSPNNNFELSNNNNNKGTSNFNSNSGINSNLNTGVVRPETNNVYSGNSPNLSDGANLIPNNLQLPLDTNSQSYGPLESSGLNQQNPAGNPNQNNYQNTLGSTLSRPSPGRNPLQYNPNQPSGIENSVGSSLSQPLQGNVAQQLNPIQTLGIDNSGQQFGNGPSSNSVNTENSSFNQKYPINSVANSGSAYNQDNTGERNPKQLNQFEQSQTGGEPSEGGNFRTPDVGKPLKPVLISAQMQIVDKNTDVFYKNPDEKDGLPKGLTKGDMENLLYTFNYTLGFHGHHEEGYTNGAKQGYYFVTGRNGVRTRVDYVADENGFRPKITQEVLDLISEEVPKPETEKDEKYGLKGYEFKWLYFPVGSKQR